jgi:hypothetical protein
MARRSSVPNLPGTYESGSFRLTVAKFHGRREITLVHNDQVLAKIDGADLVDLQEVVSRALLFVTEESFAMLPPDED